MNISTLTAGQLKQAIALLDEKEALQQQIESLDERIASLLGGESPAPAPARRPGRKSRGGGGAAAVKVAAPAKRPRSKRERSSKRGDLKIKVMGALKEAGEVGLSIKEMAEKLAVKGSNLYAWFGSTGKKVTEIQKIGPAKYKMTGV